MTENTRFRVASVTKPVTTAAVFRLIEAGRMTLDESIRRHCPAFPEKSPATPYDDVVEDDVLRPAGVQRALVDRPDFAAPDFTPGYRPGLVFSLRPSPVVDTRFKRPASGLIISTTDLLRFAVALTDDTLLNAPSRDAMSEAVGDPSQTARYTLGWQAAAPRAGERGVVQTGSMEGVTALVYLVPSRGQAVTVVSNREHSVPEAVPLLRAVADRFLDL